MKRSVIGLFGRPWIIMLSSALMAVSQSGSFHKLTGRKHRKNIYFNTFSCSYIVGVIILYIKCGHQGAAINMRGTETAFKCTIDLLSLRDSQSHELCLYYGAAVLATHFTRSDACQWCSGSVNHWPSSSVISPYSVYVVSEILCTAM